MLRKKIIQYLFPIVLISSTHLGAQFFSKVIIWGHPLHSHTHSYVHGAFYRAFKYLGYETYWVADESELNLLDMHNALFITEGQVDAHMPKRKDCYYILHNCDGKHYIDLLDRIIKLQVYTHECLPFAPEKLGECMYCNVAEKIIFLPWATDLLPYEIDVQKNHIEQKKEKMACWVGTIGGGEHGNIVELNAFQRACRENDIDFQHHNNSSMEKNIELVQKSYMAPAIQGHWQCQKGYIPCRIFKNISYGQWGITNSKTVYDLFEGNIIYNPDSYQLFYDAKDYIDYADITQLYKLMDFVRDNHTYINRIASLLDFMERALDVPVS
jgi:hypothetical protein